RAGVRPSRWAFWATMRARPRGAPPFRAPVKAVMPARDGGDCEPGRRGAGFGASDPPPFCEVDGAAPEFRTRAPAVSRFLQSGDVVEAPAARTSAGETNVSAGHPFVSSP